ncbi:MAG: RHS repeat-associated core domain-containing protein [Chloroflexi bacterium]|nr:RHS repeat-associated core domain-containing protein [Chloroflexota bacterium]
MNRFTFHGRPVDLETGLYYFRNRYFDPELGRFITADPLGYVDGPSMYQFAGYSPSDHSDPMGNDAFVIKYGPEEEDTDVYATIRFMRVREDPAMTDEKFSGVVSGFLSSTERVWSDLRPEIILVGPGYVKKISHHGQQALEWESENEAFVADVIIDSSACRSTMAHFCVGRLSDWGYAHEFGHHLGLEDYYHDVLERNAEGGVTRRQVPDVVRFGKRAASSLMGSNTRERPVVEDIREIRDPSMTKYELPESKAPVHHLNVYVNEISDVVSFFEMLAVKRDVDLSYQIELLRSKRHAQARRVIVRWMMHRLFPPGML